MALVSIERKRIAQQDPTLWHLKEKSGNRRKTLDWILSSRFWIEFFLRSWLWIGCHGLDIWLDIEVLALDWMSWPWHLIGYWGLGFGLDDMDGLNIWSDIEVLALDWMTCMALTFDRILRSWLWIGSHGLDIWLDIEKLALDRMSSLSLVLNWIWKLKKFQLARLMKERDIKILGIYKMETGKYILTLLNG